LAGPLASPFGKVSFGQGLQPPGDAPEQMLAVPASRLLRKHGPDSDYDVMVAVPDGRGAGTPSQSRRLCGALGHRGCVRRVGLDRPELRAGQVWEGRSTLAGLPHGLLEPQ